MTDTPDQMLFPEVELRRVLAEPLRNGEARICEVTEAERISALLSARLPKYFPFRGSERFLSATEIDEADSLLAVWRGFLDGVYEAAQVRGEQMLFVLWDDDDMPVIAAAADVVRDYFSDIAVPPHLFITPATAEWCVCFRMEGDAGYARLTQ
jgi:hypothetical protein